MAMLVGGLLLYLIEHPLAWRLIMEPPFICSSLPINKLDTPVHTEHFGAHDKYNKHLWTEIHARNRG